MRSLLRRISLLGKIHCKSTWDLPFKLLIEQAEKTVDILEINTTWQDWERYSSRQDQRMKFGGFIGSVTYQGRLNPFMPFISLGEIIHIGKNTTFGLGKYVVLER